MTHLARKSKLRRAISTLCAVAMLASLIVVPAFAAVVPSTDIAGSLTAGTTAIASVDATYAPGLIGKFSATVEATAGVGARIKSVYAGNPSFAGAEVSGLKLNIAVMDGATSVLTTDVVVAAGDTTNELISKINAQLNKPELGKGRVYAGRLVETNQPYIGLWYADANLSLRIWDDVTPTALTNGVADFFIYGPSGVTQTQNGDETAFGSEPQLGNVWWNFTPNKGSAFTSDTAGVTFGSYAEGNVKAENFQSIEDTSSGQITAIRIMANGFTVYLSTGARNASVNGGKLEFFFGDGKRTPAMSTPSVAANTGSGDATAGVVTTWTVTVPAPASVGTTNGNLGSAYNGVSVLFPKEFSVINSADHAALIGGLVGSIGATPTIITTATAEGNLITISDFVKPAGAANLVFQAALAAPQKAGAYDGAKIWVHNVGTPWSADPSVAIQDAVDGAPGTDWIPLFCGTSGGATIPMDVTADIAHHLMVTADANRATGYSLVTAEVSDKFGNMINNPVFATPEFTGAADGASLSSIGGGQYVWQLAKTPGVNKVTFKYDDPRSAETTFVVGVREFNNVGFGEPAKVVVLPGAATYQSGDEPSFQIQLQDAAGNPTSWLDDHSADMDWFEVTGHSENNEFPYGLSTVSRWVHRGWTRSSGSIWNEIPTNFNLNMDADGPDTWTIGAKARSGSVKPAEFVTIDIAGKDPAKVGVAVGLAVVATAKAPADYAVADWIYNDKDDDYSDSAFGYAAADGSAVKLEARVVDAYGDVVTAGTANVPVRFSTVKFDKSNAILPTGHIYETTTTAGGVASVDVKSFEPTQNLRWVPGFGWSWFTPVKAELTQKVGASNWAYPCGGFTNSFEGYGFTYFHGAKLNASLEKMPEGADKTVALADGADTVAYNATAIDPAFDTPVAGWDVKFTTSFGTFANGSKSVTVTTDAAGKASAAVKSATAGTALLRAYDRLRTSFIEEVSFTDYAAKSQVIEPTKRAGDRAAAKVRVWFENIKTGAVVTWGKDMLDVDDFSVYGTEADGDVVYTNDTNYVSSNVDTNADGKYDAYDITIPALDGDEEDAGRLESAGKRWALVYGSVGVESWVGNVFYNDFSFVAAPARPEVTFVKEASLNAEGNQLSRGISLEGSGYTPGADLPDFTDEVPLFIGDITTGDAQLIGWGYVGRDGKLLPTAVVNGAMDRMAPGQYDITVDGLVFKDGLTINNLFKQAWVSVNGKTGSTVYVNKGTTYPMNVNAFGASNIEVWAGSLKLANSSSTGAFKLDTSRLAPGLHTITAKITWTTNDFMFMAKSDAFETNYTTVVTQKIYVKESLAFSGTTLSKSGRTLKASGSVSGPAEANGSKAFSVKVAVQKYKGGKWVAYTTKTATASSSTGKYSLSYKVGSAGTYRVKVYHSDSAHPMSSKTTKSVVCK